MSFSWKMAVVVWMSGICCLSDAAPDDSIFEVCADLRKNVDFWKKIYSEVSLSEGVIHDASYPLVIFKTLRGDPSLAEIRREKEAIIRSLRTIGTKPESTWTAAERGIIDLYKAHADSAAVSSAAERVRFQRGQKERFIEGLGRSGLFLDTIRAIFRAYGIPERIAYLPHVESSFNTAAYSRAGAAGLWQFMHATGRIFGMKINYTIDERRDPVLATVAAARYLSNSYAELSSWPLAITSYNHGLQGIKRAVGKTESNDLCHIVRKYSSPLFRFASSNFYCCFLAVSELASDRETLFPHVQLAPPLRYNDITLDRFMSPSLICKYLKVDPEALAQLNPAIRPAILSGDKPLPKGFLLHIPDSLSSGSAMVALASIPDSVKNGLPLKPGQYRVKRGDNLYGIASMLGVTVKDLAIENDLINPRRLIAGQVLRIPAKAGPSAPAATVAAAAGGSDSVKSLAAPLPVQPAQRTDSASAKPVSPETTSQRFALSRVPLPRWALFESFLTPALSPPDPESVPAAVTLPKETVVDFDATIYQLDAVPAPDGKTAAITVSVDETMSHYCDWLSVGGWRIGKLNNMEGASPIRVGQRLRIPLSGAGKLDTFTTARLEYHLAIEEDFYSQYTILDIKSRVVKKGDNLWEFRDEGGDRLPVWLLRKYNKRLDFSALMPGDTVHIPLVEEKGAKEISLTPDRNRTLAERDTRTAEFAAGVE